MYFVFITIQKKIEHKKMMKENMRPEPTGLSTRISIRLPSGKRLIRSFLPTDSVQFLYDFVEAQDLSPFDLDVDFCIYNTFPRKLISPELNFKEAGLVNASVIIEEKF
jgi:hypothetical protein